jgi:predicted PurR-regulated permease PerM
MKNENLAKPFLIVLLVLAIFACYLIFKPFLTEIVISAVLVSFFYRPFLWLTKKFKGKKAPAALVMCFLVLLIVIIPISNLIIFSGKKSLTAYSETVSFINSASDNLKSSVLSNFDFVNLEDDNVKNFILKMTETIKDWIGKGATSIVKGTTGFFVSLVLILLTMFFFFVDGERMVDKIKHWSPLPNKYDVELFKKFREVSYTAVISTFLTAAIQGVIGAIGFMIVGLPAFYAGILIAFFSLIPYIGSMIIYVPVGIFLIVTGQVFKGVFVLAWGSIIIGNTDNLLRAYLLKGKSKVNPIFIIFALMGGIALFGFWGLILGPLVVALSATIFHIYELEFGKDLER